MNSQNSPQQTKETPSLLNDPSLALRRPYMLARTAILSKQIYDCASYLVGKKLDVAYFPEFCTVIWQSLSLTLVGDERISADVVIDSLSPLVGNYLTHEALRQYSELLAGNVPSLRAGKPVSLWKLQRYFEWVPVQILAARYQRNAKKERGAWLKLKILAGSPVSKIVFQWWSLKRCRYASRMLGFTPAHRQPRPRQFRHIYRHIRQFVQLRFNALVDPNKSKDQPTLTTVEVLNAMVKFNRGIMTKRMRKSFKCPLNLLDASTHPCYRCPLGYSSCEAATHPSDYVVAPCPGCNNEKAHWDVDDRSPVCVSCTNKEN